MLRMLEEATLILTLSLLQLRQHLPEDLLPLEPELVHAILDSVRRVPVATVIHIPCSIRLSIMFCLKGSYP